MKVYISVLISEKFSITCPDTVLGVSWVTLGKPLPSSYLDIFICKIGTTTWPTPQDCCKFKSI